MNSPLSSDARTISMPAPKPSATLAAIGGKRRRILFAVSERGRPTASLQRAIQFCDSFNTDLHLLRVLPELTNLNPIFPQLNLVDALNAVDRTLAALRSTQTWLEDGAPDQCANTAVEVRSGAFVEQVATRAAEIDAALIVLPPYEARLGATATTLARTARVPVLLARGPKPQRGILAASDLQDLDYPVLRLAERIGLQFDAPVVALHNVDPIPVHFALDVTWPTAPLLGWPTMVPMQDVMKLARDRLERATEYWKVSSRSVVAVESNAVEAILKEASSRNADLIVLGTRPHSWFDQIFGTSVSDRVIAQAQRSVLVTPLDSFN